MILSSFKPQTFFLIYVIFLSTGLCTPAPKPKAQPKWWPPIPPVEPPPDQPRRFYESENSINADLMNVWNDIGPVGKNRLLYHFKIIIQTLRGQIHSGKLSEDKVRELMSNFVEAAVVGGAGKMNAESTMMNRIPIGARWPEVAVVGGSESAKSPPMRILPLRRFDWKAYYDKYLPQAGVVGEAGGGLKKKE